MRFTRVIKRRLGSLFRRSRADADLQREIELHFEQLVNEAIASGMSESEARIMAHRQFGPPEKMKEECRDMRRVSAIEHLIQDFTFAIRSARHRPAFTIVLVGALALGIGLTTSIFSVFYGVLLRPLPFRDPSRLVLVKETLPRSVPFPISMPPPHAIEFSRSEAFKDTAIFVSRPRNMEGNPPERVDCLRASWRLLPLLGISPAQGRNFTEQEDRNGTAVAIVSEALAKHRFAGQNALGKIILLDKRPYQIIGVLPGSLVFPTNGMQQGDSAGLWVPLSLTSDERSPANVDYSYSLIARLADGVTLTQARQMGMAVIRRIIAPLPAEMRAQADMSAALIPLQDEIVGDSRQLLFLLLGAVGALLLITCLNVSNMLLSRGVVRRREVAVRAALGASSQRIISQMLHENLFLFLLGGALGALCAMFSQHALIRLLPPGLPRTQDIRLDTTVLAFTLAVSLITGLIFGLAPALGSLQIDLRTALQEGSRAMSGGRLIGTTRKFLVIGQIALAVVLLTSAGLLLKSFFLVLNQQAALRTEHVLTFGIALPEEQYPKPESTETFYRELTRRLQIPGSKAIGFGTDIPLEGRGGRLITPDQPVRGTQSVVEDYTDVEGAYFQSLGLPLISGRFFDDHDSQGSEPVSIVNEAFSEAFWPGKSALNHRFKIGPPRYPAPWIRVVGVVGNVSGRQAGALGPHIYVPFAQEPVGPFRYEASFVLRTSGPASSLDNVIRNIVHSLDPSLPVLKLRSMDQVVSGAVAPRSANARLVVLFGLVALLLTALGVYGVVAYSVSERTREIGIRVALGAARSNVWASVVWEGTRLALLGVVVGVPISLVVGQLIRTLLYGVSPQDPFTLSAVVVAVGITDIMAVLIPSWRAVNVDPLVALRYE
ncbi:MAG: ADOP family duplicated permease [Bryobacteraceae bacterium]